MERTETRIDRVLVERARERARREGILDGVAAWQREHGVEQLSEGEAMKLAIEEQHAYRSEASGQ